MAIVYLSLGSNIGDRVGYIQQATSLLGSIPDVNIVTTSSFYETEPWKMQTDKWFVNAIVQITTTLEPEALLNECQKIEAVLGRIKEPEDVGGYKDRTVDIDIIFYDKKIFKNERLTIPHPFFHRRAFMLVPMLEIAEDFIHPVFNKSVEQLYDDLENPEAVYLYGTRIEEES